MDPATFLVEFAVAAAVGGLIGVEREHRGDQKVIIAGVRTFPLISIAGFLIAFLANELKAPIIVAVGVGGAFAIGVFFIQMRQALGQTGMTTPVAMVVTFVLGLIIGYGYTFEGVVVGVVTTFLLVSKRRLHGFAQILDDDEILSALQFITILFILLPLTAALPGEVFGQSWLGRGALVDPFVILLVVVFVSSISFASLLVMRQLGPRRGLAFSGIIGGLVNSEATTAGLAHRSRDEPSLVQAAVVGSLLASTAMLLRNLAIAAFADRTLAVALRMLPFILPLLVAGAALAYWHRPPRGESPPAFRVKNPFAVLPALRFAAIFAAVSVVTTFAQRLFGDVGVYVASLGGFVSAGAVIASLASLHATGGVALGLAIRTALLATAASVAGKLVILRAVDEAAFRRALVPYGIFTAVALVCAGAAFVLA